MNVSIPLMAIGGAAPDPALLQRIAQTSRKTLEQFVAAAIDALDIVDGDPDLEPAGDEQDGNGAEDDECAYFKLASGAAGCVVSDNDIDDGRA